jgi:hypothetical protein
MPAKKPVKKMTKAQMKKTKGGMAAKVDERKDRLIDEGARARPKRAL